MIGLQKLPVNLMHIIKFVRGEEPREESHHTSMLLNQKKRPAILPVCHRGQKSKKLQLLIHPLFQLRGEFIINRSIVGHYGS